MGPVPRAWLSAADLPDVSSVPSGTVLSNAATLHGVVFDILAWERERTIWLAASSERRHALAPRRRQRCRRGLALGDAIGREFPRGVEDRIGDRADVRVDAAEVAQHVEMQRRR